MKKRPLPSSADVAAEAYKALGLRKRLPPALQKKLSGTRPMPTEATAGRRSKSPHEVRQRLVGGLLYAMLPPESLQVLMKLPDLDTAWSRWTGMAHLTADRAREWDSLIDALLFEDFEHPLLRSYRRLIDSMRRPINKEHAWIAEAIARSNGTTPPTDEQRRLNAAQLEQGVGAIRESFSGIARQVQDPRLLQRLAALAVRFVVREIALREAAASLAWDMGQPQDLGPTWHLLPPMDWLKKLMKTNKLSDIPKTTRARWNDITRQRSPKFHWSSIEKLVKSVADATNADAASQALLRVRIGCHLIMRRLGFVLQRKFPNEHSQISTAYTRQVASFRRIMEQQKDGISLGSQGNPRSDLMEIALFGPTPSTLGGHMTEWILRNTTEDQLEHICISSLPHSLILAAPLLSDQLELRHILASSDPQVRHPLGLTSLLTPEQFKVVGRLLEGGSQ